MPKFSLREFLSTAAAVGQGQMEGHRQALQEHYAEQARQLQQQQAMLQIASERRQAAMAPYTPLLQHLDQLDPSSRELLLQQVVNLGQNPMSSAPSVESLPTEKLTAGAGKGVLPTPPLPKPALPLPPGAQAPSPVTGNVTPTAWGPPQQLSAWNATRPAVTPTAPPTQPPAATAALPATTTPGIRIGGQTLRMGGVKEADRARFNSERARLVAQIQGGEWVGDQSLKQSVFDRLVALNPKTQQEMDAARQFLTDTGLHLRRQSTGSATRSYVSNRKSLNEAVQQIPNLQGDAAVNQILNVAEDYDRLQKSNPDMIVMPLMKSEGAQFARLKSARSRLDAATDPQERANIQNEIAGIVQHVQDIVLRTRDPLHANPETALAIRAYNLMSPEDQQDNNKVAAQFEAFRLYGFAEQARRHPGSFSSGKALDTYRDLVKGISSISDETPEVIRIYFQQLADAARAAHVRFGLTPKQIKKFDPKDELQLRKLKFEVDHQAAAFEQQQRIRQQRITKNDAEIQKTRNAAKLVAQKGWITENQTASAFIAAENKAYAAFKATQLAGAPYTEQELRNPKPGDEGMKAASIAWNEWQRRRLATWRYYASVGVDLRNGKRVPRGSAVGSNGEIIPPKTPAKAPSRAVSRTPAPKAQSVNPARQEFYSRAYKMMQRGKITEQQLNYLMRTKAPR